MLKSWALIFILIPFICEARVPEEQASQATSSAYLEIGIDSNERKFFRPRFRYDFPLSFTSLYLDLEYTQHLNSRLKGEIDFWIRVGSVTKVSDLIDFEFSLNHFCRHKTSYYYPRILDLNELLGRFWLHMPILDLGIGGGTYLRGSNSNTALLTADLDWPRIFFTEFFGRAQIKWLDLEKLLYEFELGFSLDPSLDFFVRYTRHYEYPKTAYLGMRLNSRGKLGEHIDNFRFRGSIVTGDGVHKVLAQHEFRLDLYTSTVRRLLLTLDGRVPIKRGDTFFGKFHPDDVSYRVELDYEILLRENMRAYTYGLYNVRMPADRADYFSSSLGLGVGLRNQSDFLKLRRAFRYDVYVGQNFSRTFDMGICIGVNSMGQVWKWGANARLVFDPDATYCLLEIFIETGQEVRIRPFLAYEYHDFPNMNDTTRGRFLIGIDLFTWN